MKPQVIPAPNNPNYCGTVVKLQNFVDLPNCDNVKSALIFGNSVIVSKTCQTGDAGIFFPVETQLNDKFLANNNLYRHAEWGNIDQTKTGFFEPNGRVKAVRFRGHKSEGFWIPISSLNYLEVYAPIFLYEGNTFDHIGPYEICCKYIVQVGSAGVRDPKSKAVQLKNSIIDGQFRFHFDTEQLRKNISRLNPNDIISISDKWHGTSGIFSRPLVIRNLNWFEKLLHKIGVGIQLSKYGFTYSSRKVIKGVDTTGDDIYGIVAKKVSDKIPNSYTIYGEIVGYTPTGSPIQVASGGRPYHYGCAVGSHRFLVYRIVTTNIDGKTLELSWPQMKQFCNKYGLEMVKELYYGRAGDLLDGIATNDGKSWEEHFLGEIEARWVNDQMCEVNNKEVPAEGVVVRRDGLEECESWKLKNFKFLEDETKKNDKGIVDMETTESNEEAV